jgi:MOSC domain-containing protein YiiM
MDEARIVSLQIGLPRQLGTESAEDPMDRPWSTGLFKEPISGPLWLGHVNLTGDGQADLKSHGGPDKAVCVYPALHYTFWRRDLELPELPFGAFGENFTIGGIAEPDVCIGDVYAVGDAIVQVSQPRQPCWKLARRWRVRDLAARAQETGFTGWYLRVLQEGEVSVGLPLRLQDRPCGEWTVARANEVMHRHRHDRDAALSLAACSHLSANWRATLQKRAESGENPDPRRRLVGPNAYPDERGVRDGVG